MLSVNNNALSTYTFPACPGLIRSDLNIPPPIPLMRQKEIDDPTAVLNEEYILSANISFLKHEPSPTLCTEDIVRFLNQFGEHPYDLYSNILVNGYVRNIQHNISFTIPSDINTMCSSYYFEQEYKYIHFALRLYKVFNAQCIHNVSGTQLVSIIKEKQLLKAPDHVGIQKICSNCAKYEVIELVSYKTNFMSLFEETESRPLFKESKDFVYKITDDIIKAFTFYLSQSKAGLDAFNV